MSGQAGARGYLIQAVIAVLKSLDDLDWTECVLEPMLAADKIDLLFRYATGERVCQIKSSQNAFGEATIRKWAGELEAAYPGAKRYELVLIGPPSRGALLKKRVGNVDVPTPQPLSVDTLLKACAQQLDHFIRALGHGATRPRAREILVGAFATRLGCLAASGKALSREDLQALLAKWVAELLPPDASDNSETPHQLPGAPTDFVGRSEELAALRRAAERGDVRAIVICGLTGVGKSVLAATFAATIESSYPDGQIYLDLRGPDLSPRPQIRAITEVIQSFKPSYAANDDEARCLRDYRTLLYGRRVLMLAENAESAEQVAELIPPTAESLLIITTQSRFDLSGAIPINLDVLSHEDGTNLVQLIVARVTDLAPRLAEICGYLPLAIRIACGTLNARPDLSAHEYIERLTGMSERAKLVRAALDVSLAHVPPDIRRFLVAATAFAPDFSADGISAVLDQTKAVTDAQLGISIGRYLIEWDERRGCYRLHDLVRAYILDVSDPADISTFHLRHAQYYAEVCSQIDQMYRLGGDSIFMALHLFDSEYANIDAGFSYCSNHASTSDSAATLCAALVHLLTRVMDLRLSPIERARVLDSGLKAAHKLGNNNLIVAFTGNLGRAYRELGEYDLALNCHKWVLEMTTEAGAFKDQTHAHLQIGLDLLEQGAFLDSVGHLEKALNLSRNSELAMKSLEADALINLVTAYLGMEQPAKALNVACSAMDLARELNEPRLIAIAMTNLGMAHAATPNDPSIAVQTLEWALVLAINLGDRRLQFSIRFHLAAALARVRRSDEAMEMVKSLRIETAKFGYTQFEVAAMQAISDLQLANGDLVEAAASIEEVMQLARSRSDRPTLRKSLQLMAQVALRKGEQETAITFLEERLALASNAGEEAHDKWALGHLLATAGHRDRAVTLLRKALEYFASTDHENIGAMEEAIRRIENCVE